MAAKLLLLEDDTSLGETLSKRLNKNGFQTHWSQSLSDARASMANNQYDLLIFDVGLPDGSGFELAKEVGNNCPIIFLTALNDAENRLQGYELGAVDYIPKPFHLKELFIRIEKALPKLSQQDIAVFNNIQIHFDSMTITNDKKIFHISKKDFEVLVYLMKNQPRVISRDEILDQVWGEDHYPSNRTIDNIILRLRQYLGESGGQLIHSVRGIGYQWTKGADNE